MSGYDSLRLVRTVQARLASLGQVMPG